MTDKEALGYILTGDESLINGKYEMKRVDISRIPKYVIRNGSRVKVNLRGSQDLKRITTKYPELKEEKPFSRLKHQPFVGLKFL